MIISFMIWYLRKRGWLVFYLKDKRCTGNWCWVQRYTSNLVEYPEAFMLNGYGE